MPYKNIEDERNRCRKYYAKHREQVLQHRRKYRIENREIVLQSRRKNREKNLEYCKQWYIEHREQKKQYTKKYQETYPQWHLEYQKQYYKTHLKEIMEKTIIWRENNPIKVKEMYARHSNKRRRLLGFIPLNKCFEGSVAHHININEIVYMPEKVHRSIWHCLETGKNMIEINKIAINFINKGGELICE